jgi:ferredoxin-thioredoxin reductase catalytic subunit/rubredoxin
MTGEIIVTADEVDRLYEKLRKEAGAGGYNVNPDEGFAKSLVKGLLVNEKRYGYPACPCRLASGLKKEDLDLICPCDYRDPDLTDYDACYCALYVSQAALKGGKSPGPIPDRRPPPESRSERKDLVPAVETSSLAYPVWRCRVCGYLCAREHPPEVCPVCKAKKDRFERFM